MKFIAVITARKGSKGIKNKNILKINNLSLVEYTFKEVKKSKLKNCSYILSDSNKIKNLAKKYSVKSNYERPASVSKDNTPSIDTLKHFSDWYLKNNDYDAMVLLQPTSPLRNSDDINESIRLFKQKKLESLFSISAHLEHPYDAVDVKKQKFKYVFKKRKKFFRRQDFDVNSFFHNGAIFIISKKLILKKKMYKENNHGFYIMPKIRSFDIDEHEDIEIIKKLLK